MAKRPAKPAKARAAAPKPAANIGRPSIYMPELAARIIARLTDGEFINHICRDERMPALRAISE